MLPMCITAWLSLSANHIKVEFKQHKSSWECKHDSAQFGWRRLWQTVKHRPQCSVNDLNGTVPPPTLSGCVLDRTPEQKIRQATQSQRRRTRFAFFSLPKQSRVDHICKCPWGGRSTQNEALGRKKNELIESIKYKSASRNARKLEIRKKVKYWKSCPWRQLEKQGRGLHSTMAAASLQVLTLLIQISFSALSLAQGSSLLFYVEAFASFQWKYSAFIDKDLVYLFYFRNGSKSIIFQNKHIFPFCTLDTTYIAKNCCWSSSSLTMVTLPLGSCVQARTPWAPLPAFYLLCHPPPSVPALSVEVILGISTHTYFPSQRPSFSALYPSGPFLPPRNGFLMPSAVYIS